jgi:hypothetical protein
MLAQRSNILPQLIQIIVQGEKNSAVVLVAPASRRHLSPLVEPGKIAGETPALQNPAPLYLVKRI